MTNFQETDCCIYHEGHTFCAGGAYRTETHALVYVTNKTFTLDGGTGVAVTDWHGNVIGSYRITGQWEQYPPRGYRGMPYTMTAIRVTMLDGSKWYGRYSSDRAEACKLKRAKD